MKAKSIRRLDGQGRVILPSHIRKALNLAQDSEVTIEMTEDGKIVIYPTSEHCCICGEGVAGVPNTQKITVGTETKYVCPACFAGLKVKEEN